MAQVRAEQQERGGRHQPDLRAHEQPATIAAVDLRSEADRDKRHRDELRQPDEADRERRARQVVDLDEQRDQGELAADLREQLAPPEEPEVARHA